MASPETPQVDPDDQNKAGHYEPPDEVPYYGDLWQVPSDPIGFAKFPKDGTDVCPYLPPEERLYT